MNLSMVDESFDFPEALIQADIDVAQQLKLWEKGVSVHNPVTGRHCPDFSCCIPELLAPQESRKRFVSAVYFERFLLVTDLMKTYLISLHAHFGIEAQFYDLRHEHDFVHN